MDPQQGRTPTAEELHRYSLGQCPPERAAQIEAYLTAGPDCSPALGAAADDELVRHLRGAGTLPPTEPEPPSTAPLVGEGSAAVPFEHPRYRVIRPLGQGGMGTVYLAEHRLMRRLVALKRVRSRFLDDPQFLRRFRQEAEAAAKLSHPNIVTAHDADEADGAHFLVMEYVEGESLDRWLARDGKLPVAEACDCVRQAALGLEFARSRGLVHRDVKPHNLMRTPDGTVKVLDFGLARAEREAAPADGQVTAEGVLLGTADYVAPEQARDSRAADSRADVYGLGCTLYHLLSGRVPFPGGTAADKIVRHATQRPEPLDRDVPPALAAVVARMMAKRPEDRFRTPGDVAAALEPFTRAQAPPHHRRRLWLTAGVIAVVAVVAAVAPLFRPKSGQPAANRDDTGKPPDQPVKPPAEKALPPTFANSAGMEFVLVPRGKFWKGGGGGQPGAVEKVVAYDFYLGKYEVTQEEWCKVMGRQQVREDRKRLPVYGVSWDDVQPFLRALNERDRADGWTYRLPTDTEWEYACRGGPMTDPSESAFDFYLDEPSLELPPGKSVFGGKAPKPVGSGTPNRLGLYDMHGNVWELCDDAYGVHHRVVRGGGWDSEPKFCRAAGYFPDGEHQFGTEHYNRWPSLGLRVARVPVTKDR